MKYYCEKCKRLHADDELCPNIAQQLKENPFHLKRIIDFTSVAGQYELVTSQALDKVASTVNNLVGSNLTYEGTHQIARDIQVFSRLNTEPFLRKGIFATPEKAQYYLQNIIESGNSGALRSLNSKLTGYAQEVDWLRQKKGQISSLWQKSSLLNNNAPGVDGVTINRFTENTISRTTVKATINPVTPSSTSIKGVKEALEKGTATEYDIIYSVEGTKSAAKKAGLQNPVIETNSTESVRASNERLEEKMLSGNAVTQITPDILAKKMFQGAVVGAGISLTISSITQYMRYINGEISKDEAFLNIGEASTQGFLTGGSLSGVTLFMPTGIMGFVGGMAVGIYVNAASQNILDEVFGKGAYREILNSSGYVMATCSNLCNAIKSATDISNQIKEEQIKTQINFNKIDMKIESVKGLLEEL